MSDHISSTETVAAARYGALVWIISGLALSAYGVLGLLNVGIPGVEELVTFLENAHGIYIYLAAFLSIFLEGLYLFGNFFPGSTIILIITILSQASGTFVFVGTIISIFLGWCTAGVVNIVLANTYHSRILHLHPPIATKVQDNLLTTWFPAVRANYEVAQITQGGNPWRVLVSSIRVKAIVSLAMLATTFILPRFINIRDIDNEEGFLSVATVAVIFFVVGGYKLLKKK